MTPADIITIRKALGLTQTELGEALGVTMRAVQHYELGTRKIPKPIQLLLERIQTT
jgi:DNA-binding transcriptional regulator YiaG